MHTKNGRYDPELHMFVDAPREPDPAHLRFLRWLNEHQPLERGAGGTRTGVGELGAPAGRPVAA